MLNFPLRHFPLLLLAALALLGLTLGHLGASLVGMRLARAPAVPSAVAMGTATGMGTLRPATALLDYEIIVQRSLFAPHLAGKYSLAAKAGDAESAAPVPRSTIILLGTIAGGNRPIALTRSGSETKILHLGDILADGSKVIAIARQLLKLRYPDGSEQTILPPEIPSEEGAKVPGAKTPAIRGSDNRFAISRAEAEKARSNLGELMKQARMEPHVVNGKTDGFEVKMIRPNTIFTALGLQVGDIVKEVNGLALDSPEKALQIFQQLREAQHIVVSVVRNNAPLSLEYNLD